MAKVPVAGLVKTRLTRELGVATATRFARHATATLLARMAGYSGWQTILAVAPDPAMAWRQWPRGIACIPQGHGDLGTRMQRVMDRGVAGPVVIIGTDVPDIRVAHVREAFRLLGRYDAVLGPATDGGYWLVGLRRRPHVPRIFAGVRWSGPYALADTLANLRGRTLALTAVLSDVDTAGDFALGAAVFGRRVRTPCSRSAAS